MYSRLYEKDNYINPNIDFLVSNFIREYDIRKANISILRSKGYINEKEYNYYASLKDRSVVVGHLLKENEEMNNALTLGFKEYRQKFFESNNIQDNEVLAIRKDAIYLINREVYNTAFDYVNFICKNTYTSYYKYGRYEFYYGYDRIRDIETFDVKGMQKTVYLHDNYFNELLKCVFECAEVDLKEAIQILTTFLNNFMKREINDEFYREYNDNSLYKLAYNGYMNYSIQYLMNINIELMDVSYNRRFIETLLSYYSRLLLQQI